MNSEKQLKKSHKILNKYTKEIPDDKINDIHDSKMAYFNNYKEKFRKSISNIQKDLEVNLCLKINNIIDEKEKKKIFNEILEEIYQNKVLFSKNNTEKNLLNRKV